MKNSLSKNLIERYSRQIVLKDVGVAGQKTIINSKVLIVGAGGLGCPIADYLSRAGVGTIGIADHDKVSLSNIHRQSLYNSKDVGKFKVNVLKEKIKLLLKLVIRTLIPIIKEKGCSQCSLIRQGKMLRKKESHSSTAHQTNNHYQVMKRKPISKQ